MISFDAKSFYRFDINSVLNKQSFNRFSPFAHFLSTCHQVALRRKLIIYSNKVQVNPLKISVI